jgi:hypothetical protein
MFDFFRYRLAGELDTPKLQRALAKSTKDRRALVSIGVIDDGPFEPKKNRRLPRDAARRSEQR